VVRRRRVKRDGSAPPLPPRAAAPVLTRSDDDDDDSRHVQRDDDDDDDDDDAAAAAAPRKRRRAGCPVCDEEEAYVAREADGGEATADDYMALVFAYERRLRGRAEDAVIFERMLALRRHAVERALRDQGVPYTRWTLRMLQAHYHAYDGCHFDATRKYMAEHRALHRLCVDIDRQMFQAPDAGGDDDPAGSGGGNAGGAAGGAAGVAAAAQQPLLRVKMAELRLRASRDLLASVRAVEQRLSADAAAAAARDNELVRRLLDAVPVAGRRDGGAGGGGAAPPPPALGAAGDDARLSDMYNLGGFDV